MRQKPWLIVIVSIAVLVILVSGAVLIGGLFFLRGSPEMKNKYSGMEPSVTVRPVPTVSTVGIKTRSAGSSKSFTNKYGTPTTKCAHPGCSNYIASSGDTNCCTVHARRCLECGKYIDEDAIYCMDCLKKGLGK